MKKQTVTISDAERWQVRYRGLWNQTIIRYFPTEERARQWVEQVGKANDPTLKIQETPNLFPRTGEQPGSVR